MQENKEINFIEMKQSDIRPLKEKWYKEKNGICPVLKKEVPFDKTVIDHLHKLKSEEAGIDGKGCCRDFLEFRANALEGKITNNFKRLGLDKEIDLPTFLRNLADYLENNHLQDDVLYIHPQECKKVSKLKKSSYNKLKSLYNLKAKFPEYAKTGKITKKISKLFRLYNLDPEFYK